MKKLVAWILCIAMLIPMLTISSSAAPKTRTSVGTMDSAFAEGKDSLIVFVTGIGQSRSYLFDKKYLAPNAFKEGTLQDYENYAPLVANGKYIDRWNLLETVFTAAGQDFREILDAKLFANLFKLIGELVLSLTIRRDVVRDKTVESTLKSIIKYNVVDENGDLPANVITPRYTCPLSEYPYGHQAHENGKWMSEGKSRFYSSIPCAEIAEKRLGKNFEDYLYCFTYPPFSRLDKNVEDLHTFVETILKENKLGAKKVVLVPMSMGATVTSAYLMRYPDVSDNHVLRVVSIVGCWDGSDVGTDLLTLNYADDSADMVYHGAVGDMIGDPWGPIITMWLRLFPKQVIRGIIDQVVTALGKILILETPSLTVLIPSKDYPSLRSKFKSDLVRGIADDYYRAQISVKQRLAALEKQGVTFSFIRGYGLGFGGNTDSGMFKFFKSSRTTNSDEIIHISSTAPGTKYVAFDKKFKPKAGRELSPERSIDIAGTYYKNSTWFFYGQTHELEDNNTVLALAVDLALGNVKTIYDCDNKKTDKYYYPQFNNARNLDDLIGDYLPAWDAYCETNTPTPEQKAKYDEVIAMKNSTCNDPDKDNALIEEFRQMLVEMGAIDAPKPKKESKIAEAFNKSVRKTYDRVYERFGAKGFFDK